MAEEVRPDTSVAHSARVYGYLLGGKDNFEPDRMVAEAMIEAIPSLRHAVRENRAFLHRAAHSLVRKQGIGQFLDIGVGLPTCLNLHESVQAIEPTARIAYVDNDPLVLAFARALLTSDPPGRCAYIEADLREPHTILDDQALADTFDLGRPVGLTLIAVLELLADDDDPWDKVAELRDAMPSGSCLAITHATADFHPSQVGRAVAEAAGAGMALVARTREEIAKFFGDWPLLEPGLVPVSAWRPDHAVLFPQAAYCWAGVACKP